MSDLLEIHRQICPNYRPNPDVKLSLDGVQEARSSNVTTDIFSVSFDSCRNIYPLRLIRPCNRYKYDDQEQIEAVLLDLNQTEATLDSCILDNPKRARVKCTKSSSATCPCEYCEASAVNYSDAITSETIKLINKRYDEQIENLKSQVDALRSESAVDNNFQGNISLLETTIEQLEKSKKVELKGMKKSQLTWPASTMNGRPRTITAIKRIIKDIEESEVPLDKDYVKGIKGRSKLLNQPNFDFILDIPCEYMHLGCQGVVRRMVELTFDVGEKRIRVTTRKLSNVNLYNSKISKIDFFREFSRRCRHLDFAVFKAQEFRNLLLFFFPIVVDSIEPEYKKERQVWLNLVFVVRACILPNNEYENVEKRILFKACELFYNLFEETYGQKNCSYSVHVLGSHLFKIRGNQPLTSRSAFMFESFYSEMKNLFKPGTVAPLKQILKNCLMKRTVEYHTCSKSIHYAALQTDPHKRKTLENNSMIYTYENNSYNLFNITKIESDTFTCTRQGKFEYKNDLTPNYDWKSIGVFRYGPQCLSEVHEINRKSVCGKVMVVDNMLITCPINVLLEK